MKDHFITKLSKEYARYLTVQKLIKLERNPNYTIALEKMLILMVITKDIKRTDEIFIDVSKKSKVYNPILNLVKYSFASLDEIRVLQYKIIDIIKKYLSMKEYTIPLNYGNNDDIYYCDKYRISVDKKRLAILKRNIKQKYKKYEDLIILIALLRYECIIYRNQKDLSQPFYNYLYNKGINYETFTTPFTSKMLLNGSTHFHSYFYDTDKYFGCSDSFLTGSDKILVIPPHIDIIVKKTINTILQLLQTNKENISYILILPEKSDIYEFATPYVKILLSPYKKFSKRLNKHEWYYENYDITGKKINYYADNELQIFVLSNVELNNKYHQMVKIIKKQEIIIDDEYEKYENILKKEYTRYLVVKKILTLSKGYEWRNILERFLNSMANEVDSESDDAVFINLEQTHPIYKQLINEIVDKKINDGDYYSLVLQIKKIINNFLGKKEYGVITYYGQQDNTFYCDDFKKEMDNSRIYALIKRLKQRNKEKYYVLLILIMLLRYESILVGGQNWNVSYNAYAYMNEYYNVSVEGFSSPLNSQLILLDDKTVFCSLFKDTDNYFGSVGNLFTFNIVKYAGNNPISVTLHIPYILHIMNMTADLIDRWLETVPQIRIFTGLPNWPDIPLFDRYLNHKYLKYHQFFEPNEFYFENSMDKNVPKIFSTIKKWIFVFSNYEKHKNEPEYKTLDSAYKYQLISD